MKILLAAALLLGCLAAQTATEKITIDISAEDYTAISEAIVHEKTVTIAPNGKVTETQRWLTVEDFVADAVVRATADVLQRHPNSKTAAAKKALEDQTNALRTTSQPTIVVRHQ